MEQQSKNIRIIIGAVVITALVASGGVYWWQKTINDKQIKELQGQIEIFKKKEKQTPEVRKNTGDQTLQVIFPNGGERICIGDELVIKWKSSGLKTVTLHLQPNPQRPVEDIILGSFPSSFNEEGKETGMGAYTWKVFAKEGYAYNMLLTGQPAMIAPAQKVIYDSSDNVFSIINCDG